MTNIMDQVRMMYEAFMPQERYHPEWIKSHKKRADAWEKTARSLFNVLLGMTMGTEMTAQKLIELKDIIEEKK